MRYLACAVRDVKVEAYLRPFWTHTPASAVRDFTDAVNDPNSPLSKHPSDFELFVVGDYDDSTGELFPRTPSFLCSGASCVEPK